MSAQSLQNDLQPTDVIELETIVGQSKDPPAALGSQPCTGTAESAPESSSRIQAEAGGSGQGADQSEADDSQSSTARIDNADASADVLERIQKPGPPNHPSKNLTPLQQAALTGTVSAMAALIETDSLEQGCFKTADSDGDTCVHYAAKNKQDEGVVIELVKRAGAASLLWQNAADVTPLHLVAERQTSDTVAALLDFVKQQGVENERLKIEDKDENTCVHFAAQNKRDKDVVVELVKRAGADSLMWQNAENQTPLHLVAERQTVDTVTAVLDFSKQQGLDVMECLKAVDEDGNTCVHYAAKNEQDKGVVIELVKIA